MVPLSFEPDNEVDDVVRGLLFHESLFRPEGSDSGPPDSVSGLVVLASIKSIAAVNLQLALKQSQLSLAHVADWGVSS